MSLPSLPPVDLSFDMSSNPNVFNTSGDETFDFGFLGNHLNQSVTNQMNHQPMFSTNNQMSNVFINHAPVDSNLINSMLISSNHMNYDFANHGNYGNLLTCVKQEPNMVLSSCFSSSSSSFRSCQNASGVLPSYGSNNQLELGKRMAQQMRRNIISVAPPRTQVSSVVDYFPIKDNPHMAQVSITETVTKRYSAVIPANTMVSVQNDIDRVKRALACESSIWNSPCSHGSFSQNAVGEQSIDHEHAKHTEILSAQPLSIIFPKNVNQNSYPWHQRDNNLDFVSSQSHQEPIYHESLTLSASPDHHDNPNSCQDCQPQPIRGKRTRQPKKIIEDIVEYFFNCSDEEEESEDDDGYDGRTHSLPYKKFGPYTCPKCNNVYDTSQKFAAHMVSVHYRNETNKEKRKRLRARYKKQFRLLNPEILGAKLDMSKRLGAQKECPNTNPEVEREESATKEDGESSKGISEGDGLLHDVVVKQELE